MSDAEKSLRKCLDQTLDNIGYTEREVQVRPTDSGASNFTTVLFQITVTSPNKETLHLFGKTAIIGEKVREQMGASNVYTKEFQVYTVLIKTYEKIYEKYNIPQDKRVVFAKYYGATIEPRAEVLLLEDLTKKNYKLFDRMKVVDWEHAAVSLTDLARFHALGYALRREDQELFKQFQDDEQYRQSMATMRGKFEKMISDAIEQVQDEYKARVVALLSKWDFFAAMAGEIGSGHNTLVHGDFRTSNIMYKRQNGRLSQVPLDFQGVREGNGFIDIYYFISLSTDSKFRKYHLDQLINLYYTELSNSLRDMGLNAEDIYPRKDFEEDRETFLPYYLAIALIFLPLIMVDTTQAPDMSASDFDMENLVIPPSEASKARLAEVIQELAQKGAL